MDYSKINRLVIVGNGFDLMHGLKTSFYDFINYCAYEILNNLYSEWHSLTSSNEVIPLVITKTNIKSTYEKSQSDLKLGKDVIFNSKQIEEIERIIHYLSFFDSNLEYQYKNNYIKFYKHIFPINFSYIHSEISRQKLFNFVIANNSSSNWGGIESDYYAILLHTSKIEIQSNLNKFGFDDSYKIDDLNREFSQIISYFQKYITLITSEEKINNNELLFSHLNAPLHKQEVINSLFSKIGSVNLWDVLSDKEPKRQIETTNINMTLFVNFNYTNTIEQYIQHLSDKQNYQHIQIHGELNNLNNPIIFGYGDELDDSYKKLENQNNNDYLRYAKSMHYLTTSNYKMLLDFLDQNLYQIYIWGHSCSTSDRVLLNTLFEHKNCISIKPFYHREKDGTDNYTDLCINMSRSFKDKKLFRDVVVNKEYCEPLSGDK